MVRDEARPPNSVRVSDEWVVARREVMVVMGEVWFAMLWFAAGAVPVWSVCKAL